MGRRKHSHDDIIKALRNLARSLRKDTLSKKEVATVLPLSTVGYHFGSLSRALEAAGLRVPNPAQHLRNRRPLLSENDLFASLSGLEQQLRREPTLNEYNAEGDYSTKPFRDRFGKWDEVSLHYRKWKEEHPTVGLSSAIGPNQDWRNQPLTSVSGPRRTRARTYWTFDLRRPALASLR
jgi:hypothetical protein